MAGFEYVEFFAAQGDTDGRRFEWVKNHSRSLLPFEVTQDLNFTHTKAAVNAMQIAWTEQNHRKLLRAASRAEGQQKTSR